MVIHGNNQLWHESKACIQFCTWSIAIVTCLYDNVNVKNSHFSLPHPHLTPWLGVILSEFPDEPYLPENWDGLMVSAWFV